VGLCLWPYGGPGVGGAFLLREVPLYRAELYTLERDTLHLAPAGLILPWRVLDRPLFCSSLAAVE